MKIDVIHYLGLGMSLVAAIAVPIALTNAAGEESLRLLMFALAGTALLFFIFMVCSPTIHRVIGEANRELQGDQPFGARWRWIKFSDEEWGMFGERLGGFGVLPVLRFVLFCETLIAAWFFASRTTALVSGFAGFAITILLTLRRLEDYKSKELE